MSVDTLNADLATLRRPHVAMYADRKAAAARVEAELSRLRSVVDDAVGAIEAADRLREERDAAKAAVKLCPYCAGAFVPEREPYEGPCPGCQRAEAAEAECARLQQALRELRAKVVPSLIAVKGHLETPYVDDERWTPWTRFVEPCLYRFDEVLDEALAGPDTPADSQEDTV